MRQSQKRTTDATEAPATAGVPASDISMATHFVETAWRVALPFLVLNIGGIFLDRGLETEPVFSVIGFFLSLIIVSVVVYRYVKKHFPESFNK